jgi:hypothetical protein
MQLLANVKEFPALNCNSENRYLISPGKKTLIIVVAIIINLLIKEQTRRLKPKYI